MRGPIQERNLFYITHCLDSFLESFLEKSRKIQGKFWKIQEDSRKILENPGRFQEDPGDSRKIMEILGRNFLKIILERFNIYYVLFYKLHIFFL